MSPRSRRVRGLATWLTQAREPIFVLDNRRAVLFFNHGCEELTGWTAADVIGQICDYVSEPDPQQIEHLTGGLCPPPEVLDGVPQSVPARFVHRETGDIHERQVHFVPLNDSQTESTRILGLITLPRHPMAVSEPSPQQQLHADVAALRSRLQQRYSIETVIAGTPAMQRVLAQLDVARHASCPVLFVGEPGTGREHLARVIHYQGPQRLKAFVPLDCRQSTTFELKRSLKRLLPPSPADEPTALPLQPGTLYLKDVDHLPRELQEMLVEYRDRFDAGEESIRLMAAASAPLEAAVADDRLLEDLHYLITPLTIAVPPLRTRTEDIPLLAQHVLEQLNRDQERQVGGFTPDVLTLLAKYNWPLNQDELEAVIAEAYQKATGPLITAEDLPFRFRTGMDAQRVSPPVTPQPIDLQSRLDDFEREHIRRALEQARQNKSQAAELLGLTRPRLYRRMEALGLVAGDEG
ncbi:sigma 54-interacting transcriptional regulator [Maioricimonas sp. JC845]|uniref:sigma 54-interacting transcriptional regulator n=1 Tax=Maioricimonas sp. JC845 TaxID=3232138 RepID=UPI003459E62E